jgi:lipid A 3-O-deacylase
MRHANPRLHPNFHVRVSIIGPRGYLAMRKFLIATVLLWPLCTPVLADDPKTQADEPTEKGTISLMFENDIFYHTDRDYTNGVQIAWTSGPKDNWDDAVALARDLPFFAQTGEVRTSIALGQDIYTPRDTEVRDPDPRDRPYAGFLYASFGLIDKTDDGKMDQLNLQLGVIGPASLAEQTQNTVHKLINDDEANGWKYQLNNEPAANLIYERTWKLIDPQSVAGLLFDIEPHAGAAVGNVYDYVNAGAMARLGFPLPDDYGPVRIEPSSPGSNFFEPTGPLGAYVFVGVDTRAVARNIFLDGNTWDPSRHVDKLPFVADLEMGAAITTDNWRLTFTHVVRSQEFQHQDYREQFGSVNLSYRY